MGMASQTPSIPIRNGSTRRLVIIRPKVRTKEMTADMRPSERAVNRAEAKMVRPENRKLKAKMVNPWRARA